MFSFPSECLTWSQPFYSVRTTIRNMFGHKIHPLYLARPPTSKNHVAKAYFVLKDDDYAQDIALANEEPAQSEHEFSNLMFLPKILQVKLPVGTPYIFSRWWFLCLVFHVGSWINFELGRDLIILCRNSLYAHLKSSHNTSSVFERVSLWLCNSMPSSSLHSRFVCVVLVTSDLVYAEWKKTS